MARIRTIKPEFWTDERVVNLSPLARLLFIGMWNFVDDDGRAAYSPSRLKMQILPADSVEVSELLGEIRREKLIEVYTVDEKEYFHVCNFAKHQKVDKRTPSKHPSPPNSTEFHRIPPNCPDGRDQGREKEKDQGRERERDAREGDFLDETWKPSDTSIAKAKELGLSTTEIERMVDRFVPWNRSKAARSHDWDATFQSWLPDEAKRLGRSKADGQTAAAIAERAAKNRYRVEVDTPQWRAWAKHLGKNPPRDSQFGWWFESEWPPGHEPQEAAA